MDEEPLQEKTIETAFLRLMRECYKTVDKRSVQWQEQRKCFYAAVAWVMNRLALALKDENEPNPVTPICSELREFLDQQKAEGDIIDDIRRAWQPEDKK